MGVPLLVCAVFFFHRVEKNLSIQSSWPTPKKRALIYIAFPDVHPCSHLRHPTHPAEVPQFHEQSLLTVGRVHTSHALSHQICGVRRQDLSCRRPRRQEAIHGGGAKWRRYLPFIWFQDTYKLRHAGIHIVYTILQTVLPNDPTGIYI